MYDLYKDECQNKQRKYVKEHVYRHVFCTEYNMSFHKPKKDQCLTCHKYNQMEESGNIDNELKENYIEHKKGKFKEGRRNREIRKKPRKTNHIEQ